MEPAAGRRPANSLSGVGTATPYDVTAFSVDSAGSYAFQSTATSPPNWDNFTFLYQNAFSTAAPLTNVLIGDDDDPGIGLSGFTRSLAAGVSYYHVETGFSNTDSGTYKLRIQDVTPPVVGGDVPEPETVALIGIALAGLGLTRGRVRATAVRK